MEKLAEKLDSYDILNNLLPGIVLNFLFEKILGVNIVNGNDSKRLRLKSGSILALIILNEKIVVKNIENRMIKRHKSVLKYICITSSAPEFE